jgi:hypothetical protein
MSGLRDRVNPRVTKLGYSAWEHGHSSVVESHDRSFDVPPVNEGVIYALQGDFFQGLFQPNLSFIKET